MPPPSLGRPRRESRRGDDKAVVDHARFMRLSAAVATSEKTTTSKPGTMARIMVSGPLFYYCQTGGENDRLGAGAYRRSHRCLRHSISAVGLELPSTEAGEAR